MLCTVCGNEIPLERLKILPKTKTCVTHSTSSKLVGVPVTIGTGDHTYTDLNIMTEDTFKKINKGYGRDTLAGLGVE